MRRACAHPQTCGGATKLNRASPGIEIANRQDGNHPFTDWQIEAAAAIVRHAAAQYPNLVQVTNHARLDPARAPIRGWFSVDGVYGKMRG